MSWGPTLYTLSRRLGILRLNRWWSTLGVYTLKVYTLSHRFGSRQPMPRCLHFGGLHFVSLKAEPQLLDVATQSLGVYTLGVYTVSV